MPTNQEMLEQASAVLAESGVRVNKALSPTVPTTDSLATGDFMNRKQVDALVDLTVSQNAWLAATSVLTRTQKSGEINRIVINDVVTEGVTENAGQTVSTHPDTDTIEYQTGKYQATWYMTREDIREARASGEANFGGKVRAAFAKAMGNDLGRAALLSDTTLPASSRLNRLLRKRDGWLKKIRASGIRHTTTRGSAYARELYAAMLDAMPDEYADDPSLRWLVPRKLDLGFTQEMAAAGEAGGFPNLGERAMATRERLMPHGIAQLIVPQMPTTQGADTVDDTADDADAVADDGDTTLTATVNTLFGGASSTHQGRKVTITYTPNGQSETLTVAWTGSALVVRTAGSLGQSSIDTDETNYAVDFADLTSAILTNPANLGVVICDQVRAYQKFEQEFERIRIDIYYEADFILFNENAVVLQDGIIAPSYSFGA